MLTKKEVEIRRKSTIEDAKRVSERILEISKRLEACVREAEIIPLWLIDLEDHIRTLKLLNIRYNTLSEVEHEGKNK